MLKKTILTTAAVATTLVAMPSAAQAQSGYYGSRYDRNYSNNSGYQTDRYGRTYTYDRYGNPVYVDNGRYGQNGGYYGNGSYGNGSYGNGTYGNGGYYGRSTGYYGQQRCNSGSTGTIVGGALGALIGSKVARGNSYGYGYRSGGNGTVGAIVGGAVGALAGNAIAKGNCR